MAESHECDFKHEVDALRVLVDELRAELAGARAEIAELKARLGENSSNSSRPPSSDGYGKPTCLQRDPGERKAGKQKGTPGSHLAQVPNPDAVVVHVPDQCGSCHRGLDGAEVESTETRQVFDIPPMRISVTEYQAQSRRCRCGALTTAAFPDDVNAPALYGTRLQALATYLIVFQHIPYDRARQLFSDVLGVELSTGTINTAVAQGALLLEDFVSEVREQLRGSDIVHVDETGARVAGKLHWVHVASTDQLTAYLVHEKRGGAAIDAMGVLPRQDDNGVLGWDFDGVAVHDGWKPYRNYDVTHALCNAHHLRELAAAGEVWDQGWANDLVGLLVDAKDKVETARQVGSAQLDAGVLHGLRCRYGYLIAQGRAVNQRRPGRKQSKTFNLLERLDAQRDDVLRFTVDFGVPFDNNQGERDIRMVKLQQKISGCWRTFEGAERYLLIRSYISTARKQGHNALDVLCRLIEGDPWMPARAGP